MQENLITGLTILVVILFALFVYKQYDLSYHKHQIEVLNDELDNCNQFNESLITDIKTHKATIDRQTKVLIERWNKIDELNKEKDDLFKDNQELKIANKNLTEANDNLRKQNTDYNNKLIEANDTIGQLNNNIMLVNDKVIKLDDLNKYYVNKMIELKVFDDINQIPVLAIPQDSIVSTADKEKHGVKTLIAPKVKPIKSKSNISNPKPTETIIINSKSKKTKSN